MLLKDLFLSTQGVEHCCVKQEERKGKFSQVLRHKDQERFKD